MCVYALTTTDCPCCSTSTLYLIPSPRNCSAVSRPHCTRTDTASDPRRARYTDTVTFLTASVGAGRRKHITWESNAINCSWHRYQEPPTPPATVLDQAVHTSSTSLAKLPKVSASLARQPFHSGLGGKGTSGHFRQVLVGTAGMLAEPISMHSSQL